MANLTNKLITADFVMVPYIYPFPVTVVAEAEAYKLDSNDNYSPILGVLYLRCDYSYLNDIFKKSFIITLLHEFMHD